jgi:hypothetical protein
MRGRSVRIQLLIGTYIGSHGILLDHFRNRRLARRKRIVKITETSALVQRQPPTVAVYVRVATPADKTFQRKGKVRRRRTVHAE